MFLSSDQLRRALDTLDHSRHFVKCGVLRTYLTGAPTRHVEKLKAKDPKVRTEGLDLPYGEHGSDYLQVDPVTLEVRCGACAGELDATVREE